MSNSSSGDAPEGTITNLLRRARQGESGAVDALFERALPHLRAIAHRVIGGRMRMGDLSGTALINQACERLLGGEALSAADRRHFFFLFGRAMQQALVDGVRSRKAKKRGGDVKHVEWFDLAGPISDLQATQMDVKEAIEDLRKIYPDSAEVVRLRYYCGRSLDECAEIMSCDSNAIRQHWLYARAWLRERFSRTPPEQAP